MTDQPLTDNERLLPPHLGGHFGNTNMDEATLDYLIARYGVRSILDVGCGPGGMLDAAQARGVEAYGIDGDHFMARGDYRIVQHDYAVAPMVAERNEGGGWYFSAAEGSASFAEIGCAGATIDLIWCTEFVEHVEAQYQDNYLATFDAGRVLFLTAAPPGFPGWHHVNCQPESYWIDLLSARGWVLDTEATEWVRNNGGHVFSQRQGLVFVKS